MRKNHWGDSCLNEISLRQRCCEGWKGIRSGTTNSLHRRKPKNPVHAAAQMRQLVYLDGSLERWAVRHLINEDVIGSRIRGAACCWLWTRLMPRKRTFIWGVKNEGARQVGSASNLKWRKAARYDSMVDTDKPSNPRNATKSVTESWFTGEVGREKAWLKERYLCQPDL